MSAPTFDRASLDRLRRGVSDSDRVTALVLAACSLPMLAFVTAEIPPRAHVAVSAVLVAVALLVAARWPRWRIVVMLLSVCVSARYIWYRIAHTLSFEWSFDCVAALALFGAELYAFVVLLCGYFQTAIVRRRDPAPIDLQDPELPWVDVFVPTYNEDLDLLRDTLVAARAMDYPKFEVYVLDDGRRPACRAMAESIGCKYVTRNDNKGAKAGNVNAALKHTKGELIAFFDADHIPVRTFLSSTVGFFLQDPKVALVQTPHYFYNPDQFERNLHLEGTIPGEQKLFYHAIQPGNDFWNGAFFCGSCAVIRRVAMEGVGGMAEETLTEDAHTALKMHAAGWRSVYLDIPLAAGIATERLVYFIGQRIRWARGMAQVFRLDNPLLKPGLNLAQRITYFSASWHFLFGLPRLAFILAPVTYLIFGYHPMFADVHEVLVFALPHLVLAWIGTAVANRNFRHSFWPEVFETVLAPYTAIVTTMALISPKGGVFKVTTKGATHDRTAFDWRHAAPTIALLVLTVAGLVGTAWRFHVAPLDRSSVLVAGVWNLYNLVVLSAAAATAYEQPQRRVRHRVRKRLAGVLVADGVDISPEWAGVTVDVSAGGARLELDGGARVPERVALRLQGEGGRVSPWLRADVLEQRAERDHTVVRLRFRDVDDAQRDALVPILYSPPDNWTGDRFPVDRPLRSAVAVVFAPLVAFTGRDGIFRALVGGGPRLPIVAPRGARPCTRCALPVEPSAAACEACGASTRKVPARATTPWRPSMPVLSAGLLAALALGVGATRAPTLSLLGGPVPLDRWDGATVDVRLQLLGSACRDLEELGKELAASSRAGEPLRGTWREDLARVGPSYNLGTLHLPRGRGREAEADVLTAALLLREAGDLYTNQGAIALSNARLESAAVAIGRATRGLGPTP